MAELKKDSRLARLVPDEILPFIRSKNYRFVRPLSSGGLGTTVLLHDDVLDMLLVCKKYQPFDSDLLDQFFENFVREMKLMFGVFHKNVVRIFNCFPYPKEKAGFILMEFVNGSCIDEFIRANPGSINDVFSQTLEGFAYLESANILHRDIRFANLMVTIDGIVKIIDFGFGKDVSFPNEFDKSISLAWPFTTPAEFLEHRYDFCTEVYFVGKLFASLIADNEIDGFIYGDVLRKMTEHTAVNRFRSFEEVMKAIAQGGFAEIGFDDSQLDAYQVFADFLSTHVKSIRDDSTIIKDFELIVAKLEEVYRTSQLEEFVQDPSRVVWCFLNGGYMYGSGRCSIQALRNFLRLLSSETAERRTIILSNLWARLDAKTRFPATNDDDIPF